MYTTTITAIAMTIAAPEMERPVRKSLRQEEGASVVVESIGKC